MNRSFEVARDPELELVIDKISEDHGFDIRGYKRSTLYRRLRKRVSDAGCANSEAYLALLQHDPREFHHLLGTLLINVSEFFRDPDAWDYLQQHCLEPLVRARKEGEPLRVWSVGCASGEEAYSLAICLAELLGDAFPEAVKIYATDLDDDALAHGRACIYGPDALLNVSSERLERYFTPQPGGTYRVRRDLRSAIVFGQHNVLSDPPISRLHLLTCRNLLIYFNSVTQQALFPRFHYALQPGGYLFLGKVEASLNRSKLFRPLEARHRIFQPRHG